MGIHNIFHVYVHRVRNDERLTGITVRLTWTTKCGEAELRESSEEKEAVRTCHVA